MSLEGWIVVISSIATSIAAVIGIYISIINNRKHYHYLQKEKAVCIAEDYASLITDISFLLSLYEGLNFNVTINKKIPDGVLKFNVNEMEKFFGIKSSKVVNEVLGEILQKPNVFFDAYKNSYGKEKLIELECYKNKDSKDLDVIRSSKLHLLVYLEKLKGRLLNKLETMSMQFNQNIADQEVVYQSLHQTFLRFVKLMYPHIASLNNEIFHQYYCNIKMLYNRWILEYDKRLVKHEKSKEAKAARKAQAISEKSEKVAENIVVPKPFKP